MATIYVHPGFKKALHKPDSSITGLITSIYYLGTWLSYLFVSHPTADRLGRRAAAAIGVLVTALGAALQAGAKGPNALAMMIIGRIICGFGLGIVSTSVPLYQRSASLVLFRSISLLTIPKRSCAGEISWTICSHQSYRPRGWPLICLLVSAPSSQEASFNGC
jgi:MFS family permease